VRPHEDVSGADWARADAGSGGMPLALGISRGALACQSATRRVLCALAKVLRSATKQPRAQGARADPGDEECPQALPVVGTVKPSRNRRRMRAPATAATISTMVNVRPSNREAARGASRERDLQCFERRAANTSASTRADLLRGLGRDDEACAAYARTPARRDRATAPRDPKRRPLVAARCRTHATSAPGAHARPGRHHAADLESIRLARRGRPVGLRFRQ